MSDPLYYVYGGIAVVVAVAVPLIRWAVIVYRRNKHKKKTKARIKEAQAAQPAAVPAVHVVPDTSLQPDGSQAIRSRPRTRDDWQPPPPMSVTTLTVGNEHFYVLNTGSGSHQVSRSPSFSIAPYPNSSDLDFVVTREMVTPITRIICDNYQAVLHWSRLYPDLASKALDKAKIDRLLKDDDTIYEAIRYTMQLWVAQVCGTFQELLQILRGHHMNDLVEELKSYAVSIREARR